MNIRFNRTDFPLAFRVAKSQRLFALLPEDEVAPLVASVEAAERAAKEASEAVFPADDIAAEVHAAIAQGQAVDTAAVLDRMAAAGAARAAHEAAQTFMRSLPASYRADLARFIDDCRPEMYAGLSEQLDDILDQAEVAVAALDGAHDAEAAMDAGKADEFAAFRKLAAEYADVRAAHLDLLRSEDERAFTNGSDSVAHAFFAGIAEVWPAIQRAGGSDRSGWTSADGEPFPVTEHTARAHFLAVVLNRAALRPVVATAEQALAQRAETVRATPPRAGDTIPNPVRPSVEFHGGEAALLGHKFGPANSGGSPVVWHGRERPA